MFTHRSSALPLVKNGGNKKPVQLQLAMQRMTGSPLRAGLASREQDLAACTAASQANMTGTEVGHVAQSRGKKQILLHSASSLNTQCHLLMAQIVQSFSLVSSICYADPQETSGGQDLSKTHVVAVPTYRRTRVNLTLNRRQIGLPRDFSFLQAVCFLLFSILSREDKSIHTLPHLM